METNEYVILIKAKRPSFLKDATDDEKATVAEHYEYWKKYLEAGAVVLAGPFLDKPDGIIVFKASSPEEAGSVLKNDPAVLAGVFNGTVHPFHISLHHLEQSLDQQQDTAHQRHPYVRNPTDRLIRYEVHVSAPLDEVWKAWTTVEGVNSFFASDAKIEMNVGGAYEIYFRLEEQEGLRGSEGCKVLSFLPMEMLSFSWNAPPEYPDIREQRTHVILHFRKLKEGRIRVNLAHYGFGAGKEWDDVWNYFNIAWSHVMDQFLHKFTDGPND